MKSILVGKAFVRIGVASCVQYANSFTVIEQFREKGIWMVRYYVSSKGRDDTYLPQPGIHQCPASQFRAATQPA